MNFIADLKDDEHFIKTYIFKKYVKKIDEVTALIKNDADLEYGFDFQDFDILKYKIQAYIKKFKILEFEKEYNGKIDELINNVISLSLDNYKNKINYLPNTLKHLKLINYKHDLHLPDNLENFYFEIKQEKQNQYFNMAIGQQAPLAMINYIDNDIQAEEKEEDNKEQFILFNEKLKNVYYRDTNKKVVFPNSVEILNCNTNFNIKDEYSELPEDLLDFTYEGDDNINCNCPRLKFFNFENKISFKQNKILLNNCDSLEEICVKDKDGVTEFVLPENVHVLRTILNRKTNSLINKNLLIFVSMFDNTIKNRTLHLSNKILSFDLFPNSINCKYKKDIYYTSSIISLKTVYFKYLPNKLLHLEYNDIRRDKINIKNTKIPFFAFCVNISIKCYVSKIPLFHTLYLKKNINFIKRKINKYSKNKIEYLKNIPENKNISFKLDFDKVMYSPSFEETYFNKRVNEQIPKQNERTKYDYKKKLIRDNKSHKKLRGKVEYPTIYKYEEVYKDIIDDYKNFFDCMTNYTENNEIVRDSKGKKVDIFDNISTEENKKIVNMKRKQLENYLTNTLNKFNKTNESNFIFFTGNLTYDSTKIIKRYFESCDFIDKIKHILKFVKDEPKVY